jgi:hypothetical protein
MERPHHYCALGIKRDVVVGNDQMVKIHIQTAAGYDRRAIPLETDDRSSAHVCYRVCLMLCVSSIC